MRILKTIFSIALVWLILWPDNSSALAAKRFNPNQLTRLTNSQLKPTELYFDLDSLEQTKIFRLYYKGGDLLKSTVYPLNLKAEVYVYRDGADKKVLSILNKTIKSDKSSKNVIFKTKLNLLQDGDRLFVDVFDSNNEHYGTYYHETVDIADENFITEGNGAVLSSLTELDCKADNSDPECWVEFFLKNVNFVASYDKRLITEVVRNQQGGYDVLLPIKEGRKLSKKVGKFKVNGGGSAFDNGDSFFSQLEQGYYPFFNTIKDQVGAISYIEGNGITFNVSAQNNAFSILETGVVKLAETDLSSDPENGVVEFDGTNIWYTAGGGRNRLSYGPEDFVDLSNGGYLTDTIFFTQNGKLQDAVFNGALTFLDVNPGLVLTSGVNGVSTWSSVSDLLSNSTYSNLTLLNSSLLDGIIDNATITNSDFLDGFVDNADIINSSFDNGLITNSDINDSNISNGYLEAPTINGRALFTTNSVAVLNGQILIPGGSNGLLLTSDANGNAAWRVAPDGADDLGNHIATQGLTMSGFSITNIDQANGNTANFTDINTTTINTTTINATNFNGGTFTGTLEATTLNGITFLSNNSTLQINGGLQIINGASTNYVLSSDAAGNASWTDLTSLPSNGDNLGNHLATQALDMAGFSMTNIDQANGNTANFTDINATTISATNFNGGTFTGTIQDVNANGTTYFTDNSVAQFNGSIQIQPGASNGYVLVSDFNGFASWVPGSSLSGAGDNLGSHAASQNLVMSGFSITGIGQVNGNTANLTDVNATNVFATNFNGTYYGDGSNLYGIDVSNSNGVSNHTILNNGYLQDPTINGFAFFTDNSRAQFNGAINIPTGATNGFILTSDANGNASWQIAPSGADDLGSHIANQGLVMSGFSISNAAQVNGTIANFTTVNATDFNGGTFNGTFLGDGSGLTGIDVSNSNGVSNHMTLNNGYLQDPTVNGFAFFTDNSRAQFNGAINIPTGATNGFILTSDANGNASWQIAPSGADDLGSHIANQGLVMSGFSISSAAQVNGTIANFTTVNATTGNISTVVSTTVNATNLISDNLQNYTSAVFNGGVQITTGASVNYILRSDGAGNATWVDPTTLPANGDDLGSHVAILDLNMSTLNIISAGQVNGVTANFANGNFENMSATLILNNALQGNVSSTGITIDWNRGNRQDVTLAHNTTFTFTAPSSGGIGAFTLILRQDATGSRLVTWPAAVLWPSGIPATLSTAANAVDLVSCLYDGTEYFCQLGADFR